MRRLWPTEGCCAKNKQTYNNNDDDDEDHDKKTKINDVTKRQL
jgi:hypothetical protein